MIGKVVVTTSGYDPAKGREVRDPFLGLPPEVTAKIAELVAENERLKAIVKRLVAVNVGLQADDILAHTGGDE